METIYQHYYLIIFVSISLYIFFICVLLWVDESNVERVGLYCIDYKRR